MRFDEFESIISKDRMSKYLAACNGDFTRAMSLYRYNLLLSHSMFIIVGCFEIALRNKIDMHMKNIIGNDWLRDIIQPGGILSSDKRVANTKMIISKAYSRLMKMGNYSHSKLLSEMEFGIWKYMYSNVQYRLFGQSLLKVFPYKPKSTIVQQYNNSYIFAELDYINNLRNRIAHHEPICFGNGIPKDTTYVRNRHNRIMILFEWMGIDGKKYLKGLDYCHQECLKIDEL